MATGSAAIFLLQGSDLVEMREQAYDSEALLQELLARYPALLAGEQVNPQAPRKWLLVAREAGVPDQDDGSSRWSVDHLFLDQDAVPTIVEVKRSSDTRIRREVVGQMLDYAANAVAYWPIDRVRMMFETTCQEQGISPEAVLEEYLDQSGDITDFWMRVKTNLEAGRVRLVFVADVIPPELQQVVEFLNRQMNPAEVLAVEVKQFVGQGSKTLVPRVLGQTMEAQARKSVEREKREWDEETFFAELERRKGPSACAVARRLKDWAEKVGAVASWGKGKVTGSYSPVFAVEDGLVKLVTVYTYGSMEILFESLQRRGPFQSKDLRRDMLARLSEIPGSTFKDVEVTQRPPLALRLLEDSAAFDRLTDTLTWALGKFEGNATHS